MVGFIDLPHRLRLRHDLVLLNALLTCLPVIVLFIGGVGELGILLVELDIPLVIHVDLASCYTTSRDGLAHGNKGTAHDVVIWILPGFFAAASVAIEA